MDEKALDILAQCVEANVRNAAWTTDRLIESQEAMTYDMAKAFFQFYNLVDKSAMVITTRDLEFALNRFEATFEYACEIIAKHEGRIAS